MALTIVEIARRIKNSIPLRIGICSFILLATAYYTSHLAYFFSAKNLKVEAFILPPNYMQGVQYYTDKKDNHLAPEILANSRLKILVRGWKGKAPYLEGVFTDATQLKNYGNGSFGIDIKLKKEHITDEAKYLLLRSGNMYLLSQPFSFRQDYPPQIELSDNAFEISNNRVKLNFKLTDDIGIASVAVSAENIDNPELTYKEPLFSTPYKKTYDQTINIAQSRLSGKSVNLKITATDFSGQDSVAEIKNIEIPSYKFSKPEALSIIALYKKLEQAPIKATAKDFYKISEKSSSPLTILILETCAYRFKNNGIDDEIMDNLWKLAISIDDGNKNTHRLIAQSKIYSPSELRQAINIFIDEIGDKITTKPSAQELSSLRKSVRKFLALQAKNDLSEEEENYLQIIKSKIKFP